MNGQRFFFKCLQINCVLKVKLVMYRLLFCLMGIQVEHGKSVVEKEDIETILPTSDTIQVITLQKVSGFHFWFCWQHCDVLDCFSEHHDNIGGPLF